MQAIVVVATRGYIGRARRTRTPCLLNRRHVYARLKAKERRKTTQPNALFALQRLPLPSPKNQARQPNRPRLIVRPCGPRHDLRGGLGAGKSEG